MKKFSQRMKNYFQPQAATKKYSLFENWRWTPLDSLISAPGKPVWTPREYDRFADEAYIKNVIAYRSINLIAQAAASVPWQLHCECEDRKDAITMHPLLKLLSMPNPKEAGTAFFESLHAYRLIGGNAFILAIGPKGEAPLELHLLRPDRVKIIAGKNGMPLAYEYQEGDRVRQFAVDRVTGRSDILHLRNFHPLHDWYGLSPIEAAAYSIDQHNEAAKWNQALLQNGARPSGALMVKMPPEGGSAYLNEDQYTRLKKQMEDHFSGPGNAGRPLLLEGGLEWREMSHSPKDMDFIESKNSAARDIALAFGVPPQMLGIPGDNTYSNLAEARLALWEQTVIPSINHLRDSLNQWLTPMFGENLALSFDLDQISALTARRDKIWERVENASFLTMNEKRRMLGLSPLDDATLAEGI